MLENQRSSIDFIGRREAIVEDTPGVTRDRVQYECEWGGRQIHHYGYWWLGIKT
jgi:tRNA U34 5-carboxymethylaminomethyl modifying GTPase MnmE/TrmE